MEVHHHSHHPKKWKEYITEYFNVVFSGEPRFYGREILGKDT